ncbi:putative methylesterase 12 [Nymphaea thermarum]|nr:putative methylesterase 12 [Nymphaea thermarum]
MGNQATCMSAEDVKEVGKSGSARKGRSQRKMRAEEEALHRQALAMAIQQHSQRFDGSMSRRILGANGKQNLPGVSSSRRRDLSESFAHLKLAPEIFDSLETKKIVLIHGEGFGAWCWFKSIALLEEAGFLPIALDLAGSGTNSTDANSITSLSEYAKPLMDYLCSLPENEKVILVGHSCGGACIAYALELYPKKISKAVFLSATMLSNGQRPFDVFAEELASADLFSPESQLLTYGNGKDMPPTGLKLQKHHIKGLYFNQTTAKDIALAGVSMRPIPLGPIMERLSLTQENYGSVRRFFIQTLDDRVLSPDSQEKMVRENTPEKVYKIKGSDHCPFFSKPQSLHKLLVEITQLP